MVDWSDKFVRANVFVAMLNIGLIAAHAIKDDNQSEVASYNIVLQGAFSGDELSDIEKLLQPESTIMSSDPNCFNVEELEWLTEGRNKLTEALMLRSNLKPCPTTGVNFLAVDTVSDLIQSAGLSLTFDRTDEGVSLACMRRQINMFSNETFFNPDISQNSQNRDAQIQTAKLFCGATSSFK